MATSTKCHTQKAPLNPPSLIQNGNLVFQAHHVGWIVTGLFAIISTVTSLWLINKHLQWYTNKREQRYIVRILFMVPIYSLVSLASFLFWNDSTPLLLLRDCYESTVLTSFFYLLLVYLSPDPEQQKEIFRKNGLSKENDAEALKRGEKPKKWLFPLRFIRSKPKDGLYFLQIMKWGILQYCVIRPTTTVVAIILDYVGLYCEDSWSPGWGHLYITTLVSISVSVAMYCLLQLYFPVSAQLAPKKPLLKLVAIKAVVFLTFWQASFLSLLETFGVVKNTQYMTADDITIGIAAILETFEMTIIAFLHVKAFSYKPYRPLVSVALGPSRPNNKGKRNNELGRPIPPTMSPMSSNSALPDDIEARPMGPNTQDISLPQRTPRLRSLAHAFDFRETFREVWAGCLYMTYKARGKETDGQARRLALRRELFLDTRGKSRVGRHLLNDEFDSAEKSQGAGLGIQIGVSRHVVADPRDSFDLPLVPVREGKLIKDRERKSRAPEHPGSRRKHNSSNSSWWYAYGSLPLAATEDHDYDEPPPRSALRVYHGENISSTHTKKSDIKILERNSDLSRAKKHDRENKYRSVLKSSEKHLQVDISGLDAKMRSIDRSLPPVSPIDISDRGYSDGPLFSGENSGQAIIPASPVFSSSSNTHTFGPDRVFSRLFLPSVDGESSALHASFVSQQFPGPSHKERSVKRDASPHLQVRTSVATLRRPVIIDAVIPSPGNVMDSVATVVDRHPSKISRSPVDGLTPLLRHSRGRIEDDKLGIGNSSQIWDRNNDNEPGEQSTMQPNFWEVGKDGYIESRFLYTPRPPPRPKRLTVPTPLAYIRQETTLSLETSSPYHSHAVPDRPPSPHPNVLPSAASLSSVGHARHGQRPVRTQLETPTAQQQDRQGYSRRSSRPRYLHYTDVGSDRLERSHARGAQMRHKKPQKRHIPNPREDEQPLPDTVGQAY